MNESTKQPLLVAGAFIVLGLMFLGVTGAYVYNAGMVVIEVAEAGPNGSDISLKIPGALINGAIQVVPSDVFKEAEEEIRYAGPIIRAVCDQLSDLPDFVMVEVQDRHEHVEIAKRGNKLIVDVESDDEKVHIVVPFSVVKTAAKKIERAA